jgi:hypothetical protein
MNYFYRGAILKSLEQLINKKANASSLEKRQVLDNEKLINNLKRYCLMGYAFWRLGKTEVVEKIKKIILVEFKSLKIARIQTLSFANIVTLLTLFETHPVLFIEIKEHFQNGINNRRGLYTQEPLYHNALLAIECHVDNQSKIGKEVILMLMNCLIQRSGPFNFAIEGWILLSIITAK